MSGQMKDNAKTTGIKAAETLSPVTGHDSIGAASSVTGQDFSRAASSVSGHDFSRAVSSPNGAEVAEASGFVSGHDFSRAASDPKTPGALAPAERSSPASSMTLAQVCAELKPLKGKRYWRSVDELADTAEFQAAVEREFPTSAQEWVDPVSRRGFMKLMGASLALAGLSGCTKQPDEPIYPYVKAPEDLILGKPMYFATAHPFVTGAVPLLVKSDQFRPIKVDGNPEHPYNQGSSDPFTQGTLLDLYDPDRSQHVLYRGENREWAEFAQAFREKLVESKDGTGIYFLSSTITSPTLARKWLRFSCHRSARVGLLEMWRLLRCQPRQLTRSSPARTNWDIFW